MLICKLKLRKNLMKIFRVFFGSVFEVKVAIAWENLKSGIFIYWVRTHWLVACWLKSSITWANWKVKVKITVGNKKITAGVGFEPNHVWAPCCEWTKSWVPCCKWTWNILSRTLGGSFTCVYTRGPWAVEYLAKLSRISRMFSKSFKAMILGSNFI